MVRAGHPALCDADLPDLERPGLRDRADGVRLGAHHHLPVRAGHGDADGDRGGLRPGCQTRHPDQERAGAGNAVQSKPLRVRQDRHADRRQDERRATACCAGCGAGRYPAQRGGGRALERARRGQGDSVGSGKTATRLSRHRRVRIQGERRSRCGSGSRWENRIARQRRMAEAARCRARRKSAGASARAGSAGDELRAYRAGRRASRHVRAGGQAARRCSATGERTARGGHRHDPAVRRPQTGRRGSREATGRHGSHRRSAAAGQGSSDPAVAAAGRGGRDGGRRHQRRARADPRRRRHRAWLGHRRVGGKRRHRADAQRAGQGAPRHPAVAPHPAHHPAEHRPVLCLQCDHGAAGDAGNGDAAGRGDHHADQLAGGDRQCGAHPHPVQETPGVTMDVIYSLIPGMMFFGLIFLVVLIWAVKKGQYEDMEGNANRILLDDDEDMMARHDDRQDGEAGKENTDPKLH